MPSEALGGSGGVWWRRRSRPTEADELRRGPSAGDSDLN